MSNLGVDSRLQKVYNLPMFTVDRDRYVALLRIATALVAVGMWGLSIKFSADGFEFNVNITEAQSAGMFLGVCVTVIQLVWNREANNNMTIMIVGALAYAYGIYTNFIGIVENQGGRVAFDFAMIFPILLAVFLEVTPEALLVWALTGVSDLGDFFGNILVGNTGEDSESIRHRGGGQNNHSHRRQRPSPPGQN